MATIAVFRKDLPNEKSPEHDGADTKVSIIGRQEVFDIYQMVPVNGTRPFNIRMSGGAVRIEVFSTLGAELSIDGALPAKFQTLQSSGPPDRTFTIHGRGEGRTTIFALDENRTILDRMIVSIKNERPLTYNMHLLGDSLRNTTKTMNGFRSIMTTVEKVYLLQANVRLVRRSERDEFFRIKKNLGDPIDVSQPLIPLLASRPDLRVELQKRLVELGFFGEDLNIISTWRLKSEDGSLAGFTPDLGTTCLGEAKDDPIAEATTFAHEIGHALGLIHVPHVVEEMMNDNGRDSFRMTQVDIDTVNRSGTKPLPQQ